MSKNRTDRVIVSPSPQTVSPAKHLLRFLSLWRCRFKIKSTRKLLHNLRRVVYSFSSIMWQFTGFYSANHMVSKIVYKKTNLPFVPPLVQSIVQPVCILNFQLLCIGAAAAFCNRPPPPEPPVTLSTSCWWRWRNKLQFITYGDLKLSI